MKFDRYLTRIRARAFDLCRDDVWHAHFHFTIIVVNVKREKSHSMLDRFLSRLEVRLIF